MRVPPAIHYHHDTIKNLKGLQPIPCDALVLDIDETVLYCGSRKYQDEVRLIESELPKRLRYLQSKGIAIVLLTARAHDHNKTTQTHLSQLGLTYDVLLHAPSEYDAEGNKISTKGQVLAHYVQSLDETQKIEFMRLLVVDDESFNLDAIRTAFNDEALHDHKVVTYHYQPDYALLNRPTDTEFPNDLSRFHVQEKLGGGTNSTYKITNGTQTFILKHGASPSAMKTEILMIELYRAIGVSVPDTQAYRKIPVELAQELGLHPATVVQVSEALTPYDPHTDEEAIQRTYMGQFIPHAFLGNIDAAKYDNYMARSAATGAWLLVDAGANYHYRALGDRRKENETKVTELQTLRDPSCNRASARWLTNLSLKEIDTQINGIIARRDHIDKAVWEVSESLGIEHRERDKIIETLSKRFDHLINGKKAAGVLTLRKKPNDQIEVLLSRRAHHDWHDCFGGEAAPGEDFSLAASREVREESSGIFDYPATELVDHPYCDLRTVNDYGECQIYRMYIAFNDRGDDVSHFSDHEHTEHHWVKLSDLNRSVDENTPIAPEALSTLAVTATDGSCLTLFPPFAQLLQQTACKRLLSQIDESKCLPDKHLSHNKTIKCRLVSISQHKALTSQTLVDKSKMLRAIKSRERVCADETKEDGVAAEDGCGGGGGGHFSTSRLTAITPSEAHLRMVLGEDYQADNLHENVKCFVNKYYEESKRDRIMCVAEAVIERERLHANKIHFYHGCSGEVAFAYELYTAFYKILSVNDNLTCFRVDNPLFHRLMNISEFIAFFESKSDKKEINNYTDGFRELAMSCNLFLFGNHNVKTSHSFTYFSKNSTRSLINLEVMLDAMLNPFGVTRDQTHQAVECFNSSYFKGQGFLYQFSLPGEIADRYAYTAGAYGRVNPLAVCGENTVKPSMVIGELKKNPAEHTDYMVSVQARYMAPPGVKLSCVRIPWDERSKDLLARNAEAIDVIAQRMVLAFLNKENGSDMNMGFVLSKQFKWQLSLDGIRCCISSKEHIYNLVGEKQFDKILEIVTAQPELNNMIITDTRKCYSLFDKKPISVPLFIYLQTKGAPENVLLSLVAIGDVDVNATDKDGATALILAAEKGHSRVANVLLGIAGIDVNATDKEGATALIIAAEKGHSRVANILLGIDDIDVNAAMSDGATALYVAVQNGHIEVTRMLLACPRIDVNAPRSDGVTPLYIAAENGHPDIVNALLAVEGIDVNAVGDNAVTALFIAAQMAHIEVVCALSTCAGIDLNAALDDGTTPLMIAAENGHAQVVHVLLSDIVGVDVNATDQDGVTALVISVEKGQHEVVKILLEAGANMNAATSTGATALYHAAKNGDIAIVTTLLAMHGVDVNAARAGGVTALLIASHNGDIKVVEALLAAGADVNTASNGGYTALHFAIRAKHVEVIKVLINVSAIDVNTRSYVGDTALIMAVKNQAIELVDLLLSRSDLNLDIENDDGDKAEDIAIFYNFRKIIDLISEARSLRYNVTSAKRVRQV